MSEIDIFAKHGISYTTENGYVHLSERDYRFVCDGVQAVIAAKDAEIERLQGLLRSWEEQSTKVYKHVSSLPASNSDV